MPLAIYNIDSSILILLWQVAFLFPRSDGVGRTGAFITIHAQMKRMKSEAAVDMLQYIKAIRIQRADMVSNKVCKR